MSLYAAYLDEITARKAQGLSPKPIDDAGLTQEIIAQIMMRGTLTGPIACIISSIIRCPAPQCGWRESAVLKQIILGEETVDEISVDFAFELLSHMKGGPSVEVLLDVALGDDAGLAVKAAEVLKTQVFLYEADTDRLKAAFEAGNDRQALLESYAEAEFFTGLPDIEDEIKVVTYIAAEGDISTDLLSPGNQAHSRSDRELHGKCMIPEAAQKEIEALKPHPDKRVMLIAEKGTMGVGHACQGSIMWPYGPASHSPYVPFVNIAQSLPAQMAFCPSF